MESKHKCESNTEGKKCKIMALVEKIKILGKLRGGMRAEVVGLTFSLDFV
jgi:hypothetical protein